MRKTLIVVLCIIMFGVITGCSGTDEVSIKELNEINDKITEFYINNNDKAGNLGSHYVDEENMVVVVELIDNSTKEQEKFKEEVIDSEYIKFVEGGPYNTFTIDQLKITKTNNCSNQLTEYYQHDERKVYLVCLDDINLDGTPLKDYFSKTYQTFDDSINNLIDDMELVDTYKDGGTKLYKSATFSLLKCNTIEGNTDIYIGDTNLEYQENYCK